MDRVLSSLKARGLAGTHLVISDAPTGLKTAISSVFIGAAWQRCRVHFMRNVLAIVPEGNQEMVAAAIRTIFAQPDAEHVHEQFEVIAASARQEPARVHRVPGRALEENMVDQTTRAAQQEVKRGTEAVGAFPNPEALLRLAGAVLVEAHDEWQVSSDRRYLSEAPMALLTKKSTKEWPSPNS